MNKSTTSISSRSGLLFIFSLIGILAILFYRSFDPSTVLFSNDGPLGMASTAANHVPSVFSGIWMDLNSIGYSAGSWTIDAGTLFLGLIGPLMYSKFFITFTLFS